MPRESASAALIGLLTQPKSDDDLRPACTATWLAESASANPVLVSAEEKTRAFEYIDDLVVAMSVFKEGIDRESAQDAIKNLPDRIKTALAAIPHSANEPRSRRKESEKVIYEFCCSPNSELGNVSSQNGIKCVRLSREAVDLSDNAQLMRVIGESKRHPGCHLHGSIPCTAWCTWHHVNCRTKGEHFTKKLAKRRELSMRPFGNFVKFAKVVRENGGTISFEWPRYCLGWAKQEVLDFVSSFDLTSVSIDGCAFGHSHNGQPIKKPWRIVTDHPALAENLRPWTCSGDHQHIQISGSITPNRRITIILCVRLS
jgi:hypothetical protein